MIFYYSFREIQCLDPTELFRPLLHLGLQSSSRCRDPGPSDGCNENLLCLLVNRDLQDRIQPPGLRGLLSLLQQQQLLLLLVLLLLLLRQQQLQRARKNNCLPSSETPIISSSSNSNRCCNDAIFKPSLAGPARRWESVGGQS